MVLDWHPARAAEVEACPFEPGAGRAVTAVLDSETVRLDDGSYVRLIGSLAPHPPAGPGDGKAWPPEAAAKAALERLALGRTVHVAYAGRRRDRHGRQLAHLLVAAEAGRTWVQRELLREGHARAYALPDSTACLAQLVAAEREARVARRGLWAHGGYAIRDAAETRELMALRGSFQLVAGRVRRVTVTRAQTYIDFGEDWRRDFSIIAKPAVARRLAAPHGDLKGLVGRDVVVRGWLIYRSGPAMEIVAAEEVELPEPGG